MWQAVRIAALSSTREVVREIAALTLQLEQSAGIKEAKMTSSTVALTEGYAKYLAQQMPMQRAALSQQLAQQLAAMQLNTVKENLVLEIIEKERDEVSRLSP